MISTIWSALTIVRHAVAITIVMSAAGATVAGSVHGPVGDHAAQAASTATTAVASGEPKTIAVTSELEHQSTVSVNEPAAQSASERTTKNEPKPLVTAKPVETKPAETLTPATLTEPKHETTTTNKPNDESLGVLVKDCVAKYTALKTNTEGASEASVACRKAIEATGLTSSEFWARFGPKTTATAKPEPAKKPETTKKPEMTTRPETVKSTTTMTTAQIEILVKDCFAKYLIARNTKEGGTAAVEACNRAMAASGLTGDAFWAKFGRPGTN